MFEEKYFGPSVIIGFPKCVPVVTVTNVSDTLGSSYERQQLPLRHSWSVTIHKPQELTLNKAWIDLGESEKVAGLTYVALSRVHSITDLVIEPLTLERLHAVKECSNVTNRLKQEARLSSLFYKTLQKYMSTK